MSLLEEDFGSESEDDNFNPAPLGNSDSDAAGDSEDETNVTAKTNGVQQRRRSSEGEIDGEADKDTKENGLDVDGTGEEDEDEEDDDDGDDEDDEDAISGRPRKRARRDPRNQFLDVEAEVDEEDEGDEEDEENETAGFIAETHPDDVEDLPEGAATDDRRHRELDRQRERAQQMDAEKQAQLLREKYGRRTATTADPVTVPKRLLLPSVDDPSIWGVKCKPGKEREIVFAVTKRMEERNGTKNPLPIISALERGKTMAGYVYIEARKQADILTALDGVMNVYPRTQMILIPIKEMPELLRVVKSEQLHPGGYVRIKRGKYAGDLAQIDDVESNGLEASLRIVPRLDYGQNEDDANAPTVAGLKGDAKRKRQGGAGASNPTIRPPPRLFSDVEAKKKHSRFLSSSSTFDKKHWTYMGDDYVNGFLIKDFKIQHLITENVNPTLEEVTRFSAGAEDGTENLDLTALAATLKKSTANESYLPGDTVEVYEGEQQGVWGKAISVRGDIVTISVINGDLRGQNIEVPVKGLRKRFREGDHVKVIGGSRYQDEVGMVVSIKADQVTLLSDLSMKEITVFNKDLREASDTGVAGGLGRYDIHDLVQLDPATVGCVTKVDRESLRILDQNGSTRSVMPSQISNKIERRRNAVATDRNGSEIRTDDTVREIGGEQKQGVIIHIYRSFLFLHNREQTENSGISVVRATNVATVAAKGGRVAQGASNGPDLNKMNPALMRNGSNGNAAMPPPKSFGRDRALGQTVTIRKGPYKGLLGIVKDTTDLEARVELHTKGKTISVPKDTLGFKDPLTGQNIDYTRFAGSRGRGDGGRGGLSNMGGATPGRVPEWSSGGRTPLPMAGGRTPAWQAGGPSNRAPAWSASASTTRTPMWRQEASSTNGSRTPAYASANDGSRTVNPYADGSRTVNPYSSSNTTISNRTPAWNPTATSSSFTQDPFASSSTSNTTNPPTTTTGSRTPAYESSYRTPAPSYPTPNATTNITSRTTAYDAPTPGKDFINAPTPGKDFTNAPTPAAHPSNNGGSSSNFNIASTPAAMGMGSAPTPKFSGDAPTPYAGVPETPGFGEGEGEADAEGEEETSPRYETPSP